MTLYAPRLCPYCGEEYTPVRERQVKCTKRECLLAYQKVRSKRIYQAQHPNSGRSRGVKSDFELIYDPQGDYQPGMRLSLEEMPTRRNTFVINQECFAVGTRFREGQRKIVEFDGSGLVDVKEKQPNV